VYVSGVEQREADCPAAAATDAAQAHVISV